MRGLRCLVWCIGGVATGTFGVVMGVKMGWQHGGGLCVVMFLFAALWMIDKAERTW